MRQSAVDAGHDKVPVVCHRKSRKGWLLTLRFDDIHRFVDVIPAKYEIKEKAK